MRGAGIGTGSGGSIAAICAIIDSCCCFIISIMRRLTSVGASAKAAASGIPSKANQMGTADVAVRASDSAYRCWMHSLGRQTASSRRAERCANAVHHTITVSVRSVSEAREGCMDGLGTQNNAPIHFGGWAHLGNHQSKLGR